MTTTMMGQNVLFEHDKSNCLVQFTPCFSTVQVLRQILAQSQNLGFALLGGKVMWHVCDLVPAWATRPNNSAQQLKDDPNQVIQANEWARVGHPTHNCPNKHTNLYLKKVHFLPWQKAFFGRIHIFYDVTILEMIPKLEWHLGIMVKSSFFYLDAFSFMFTWVLSRSTVTHSRTFLLLQSFIHCMTMTVLNDMSDRKNPIQNRFFPNLKKKKTGI